MSRGFKIWDEDGKVLLEAWDDPDGLWFRGLEGGHESCLVRCDLRPNGHVLHWVDGRRVPERTRMRTHTLDVFRGDPGVWKEIDWREAETYFRDNFLGGIQEVFTMMRKEFGENWW